ncbi:DUF2076 domain-containing protein [Reyranella sp.]|uniref:DUF2076 domain-containing protein n=1 Tax=Reyranella sp. TaxID=1929291 RepID=UPI0025F4BA44|nr:DUF2076 domain-containing protein [Reyranella sp.]
MESQERDLISGLFGRIQQFESQPRDPEAEALISSSVARQPAAPYLLVQTVLVQEQALKAAQERIAELEAKAKAAPAAAGFLGSAPRISPWGSQAAGSQAGDSQAGGAPSAPRSSVPSTRSPLQAAVAPAAAPAGGSFLRTAMATAAGVAGGALLFEGIRSMMGSNPFGQQQAAGQTGAVPDAQQQAMAQDDSQAADGSASEDYDTASYDEDAGQDMGGGDDDSFA